MKLVECVEDQARGIAIDRASNRVLRVVSAQATRASLLASAHATIFGCRRVSIERTQSAVGVEYLSSWRMKERSERIVTFASAMVSPRLGMMCTAKIRR